MSPATVTRCTVSFLLRVDAHLRDLGEVTRMAEVERQAAPAALPAEACPSRPRRPRGGSRRRRARCAARTGCRARASAASPITSSRNSRWSRFAAAASSCRNDCTAKAMPLERGARHGPQGVASGSIVWPSRKLSVNGGGKLLRVDVAAGNRVLGVRAERDEVILPGGELAGAVDGALERVEAAHPVEVVLHVVLSRPLQLHRGADALRDQRGLAHHVVDQPPSEPAADARLVDGHAGSARYLAAPPAPSALGRGSAWAPTLRSCRP